jgi:hypothetical protein
MASFRSFTARTDIAQYAEECVEWIDLRSLAEIRLQGTNRAWVRSALTLVSTNTLSNEDTTKVG